MSSSIWPQTVADVLDALGPNPSANEVYDALLNFDTRYAAAAIGATAIAGGGGGGNVPFVGDDPPPSPTDGMLWWDPDDNTPSGGSTAGTVRTQRFHFTETAGAGIYTAEFDLPADSLVYGFYSKCLAAWDDINGTLAVGDSDDPVSWASSQAVINAADTGNTFGDYAGSHDSIIVSDEGGFYPDGTTLTVVLTTVSGGTTGLLEVGFMYVTAAPTVEATKS